MVAPSLPYYRSFWFEPSKFSYKKTYHSTFCKIISSSPLPGLDRVCHQHLKAGGTDNVTDTVHARSTGDSARCNNSANAAPRLRVTQAACIMQGPRCLASWQTQRQPLDLSTSAYHPGAQRCSLDIAHPRLVCITSLFA